jgi:hypothetical protein
MVVVSIIGNVDWFDYVGSGALDNDLDKLRNTNREQDDTEAETTLLFGSGEKEIVALERRLSQVTNELQQYQAGGTAAPRRSTVLAGTVFGGQVGGGGDSKSISKHQTADVIIRQLQEQKDTAAQVVSFRWNNNQMMSYQTDIALKPPVSFRGRYLALMNSRPSSVDITLTGIQRARRLSYGVALQTIWRSFIANQRTPPPSSLRDFKFVECNIVRQTDQKSLPPPPTGVQPGEFACEPFVMMANIDQDNGRDQLEKAFAATSAAFAHYTIIVITPFIMSNDSFLTPPPFVLRLMIVINIIDDRRYINGGWNAGARSREWSNGNTRL